MQRTSLLNLPIYDSPINDKFHIDDFNTGMQNLEEFAQGLASNPQQVEIMNQEVIDARGMNPTLKDRLNDVDSTLASKSNISNEHLDVINDKNALVGSFNVANFAGQDLGISAPIANIIHNYTDAYAALQIDEVGEGGSILVLKNANNPSRRPDKPSNYIGNAHYIDCIRHNAGGSSSTRIFRMNSDGNMYWFDKTTPILFYSYKDDDGTACFQFQAGKAHNKLMQIMTGNNTDVAINHNKTTNYLEVVSGNNSQGFVIQSAIGNINIKPATAKLYVDGSIYAYENSAYARVQTSTSSTTASRPTPLVVGQSHFDTTLGKPIWCKQVSPAIWVDATGATV